MAATIIRNTKRKRVKDDGPTKKKLCNKKRRGSREMMFDLLNKGYLFILQKCCYSKRINECLIRNIMYINPSREIVSDCPGIDEKKTAIVNFNNTMIPSTELYKSLQGKKPSSTGNYSSYEALHFLYVHKQYPSMTAEVCLHNIEKFTLSGKLSDWQPVMAENLQRTEQYSEQSITNFESQTTPLQTANIGINKDVFHQYGLDETYALLSFEEACAIQRAQQAQEIEEQEQDEDEEEESEDDEDSEEEEESDDEDDNEAGDKLENEIIDWIPAMGDIIEPNVDEVSNVNCSLQLSEEELKELEEELGVDTETLAGWC